MANPSDIQTYLGSVNYPMDKKGIIDHAEDRGAPDEILIALGYIAAREYASAADVVSELEGSEPSVLRDDLD